MLNYINFIHITFTSEMVLFFLAKYSGTPLYIDVVFTLSTERARYFWKIRQQYDSLHSLTII